MSMIRGAFTRVIDRACDCISKIQKRNSADRWHDDNLRVQICIPNSIIGNESSYSLMFHDPGAGEYFIVTVTISFAREACGCLLARMTQSQTPGLSYEYSDPPPEPSCIHSWPICRNPPFCNLKIISVASRSSIAFHHSKAHSRHHATYPHPNHTGQSH